MTDESIDAGKHVFRISVASRLRNGDWWGDPFTMEVSAYSLQEALEEAAKVRFPAWTQHVEVGDLTPCCEHCGCPEGQREGHDDTCAQGCNDTAFTKHDWSVRFEKRLNQPDYVRIEKNGVPVVEGTLTGPREMRRG